MKQETKEDIAFHAIGIMAIIGFVALLFLCLPSCKKDSTVTWELTTGQGDVFISEGVLVTDFQAEKSIWRHSRPAKRHTVYTIHGPGIVTIRYNNTPVAVGKGYARFTTP